ncbi:MAG: cytidine deaminase [Candidatus Heimdallarchaeota archaeon]|nr:cytidine deaminase [Candidatus Heimdallarchaeota archaeon]
MDVVTHLPKLKELAIESSKQAYAPYSNFHVGAVLLMKSGNIFTGCNVEFSDYLALHAEVNAIGSAVDGGEKDIQAVVVYSISSPPVLPCGSCRQKLFEFSLMFKHDIKVLAFNNQEEEIEMLLSELLPGGEIKVDKK